MHVDEIDRTGTGIRQDAEIVSDGVDRIEGSKGVTARIVATRNVGLYAESGPQRHRRQGVAGIRCECPRPNVVGPEASELHYAFIIEVGPRLLRGDRPP